MHTTTHSPVHRLLQARAALVRAELALTLGQLLFWATLIAIPVVIGLRAYRRLPSRHTSEPPIADRSAPSIADAECGEQHVTDGVSPHAPPGK